MHTASIENRKRSVLKSSLALLVLVLLLLINHFWAYWGNSGYDEISYANIANSILKGKFILADDHANYRWIVVFLTALSYKLFGINDHTSSLMPFLATTGIAVLISRLQLDWKQTLMALFFFGLQSWILFFSDKIFPDMFVAFFFFSALFQLYQFRASKKYALLQGFILALLLFLGFLAKETILLTVPVFLYLAGTDIVQRKRRSFWLSALFSSTVLSLLYLIFIKLLTGHYLQRFYAIQTQSYYNPCSYDLLPLSVTLRRIAYTLWLVFLESGQLWVIILALVAVAGRPLKNLLLLSTAEDFFPMVSVLTLLCADLMSTSFTHYIPMCDNPRHFLFLSPVLAVVAAEGMNQYIKGPVRFFWLPVLMGFLFWLALRFSRNNAWIVYLPWLILTTAISLFALWRKYSGSGTLRYDKPLPQKLTAVVYVALALICCAQPIRACLYARSCGYRFQQELFMRHVRPAKNRTLVITNPVERNYGPYYMAYDTALVHFMSYADVQKNGIPPGYRLLLFNDGFTGTACGLHWQDMPEYARQTAKYKLIEHLGCAEIYELHYEDVKK